MKKSQVLCVVASVGLATCAHALTFECRWVEQTGPGPNQFTVIGGNGASFPLPFGGTHRIRLQFCVIDDAMGAAPAGGFIGWNVGTLTISGPANNSTNTRTPGRLNPFTFATQPGANGNPPLPGGDPFTRLTDIDATLGTQSPFWGCDASGNPLPMPQPVVRGRNTFVSVYEFTNTSSVNALNYSITAGGNLIAATEWRPIGTPVPPNCPRDPGDPPVSVTFAPFPTAPVPFTCVLNFLIPPPGAASVLGLGVLLNARRRGSCHP